MLLQICIIHDLENPSGFTLQQNVHQYLEPGNVLLYNDYIYGLSTTTIEHSCLSACSSVCVTACLSTQ